MFNLNKFTISSILFLSIPYVHSILIKVHPINITYLNESIEIDPSGFHDIECSSNDCLVEKIRRRPVIDDFGAAVINPYQPELSKKATFVAPLLANITSYSGYLPIRDFYDARLFFWFFESEKDRHAPVIVWLQGQPSTTALLSLFEEHGPYQIDKTGSLQMREHRWTKEYNVLYLDHCFPCGYSFYTDENGITKTLEDIAAIVYSGLRDFFLVYSEYADSDVYLAGEYGAGKSIPVICQYMASKNVTDSSIKLKGGLIGNGLVDVSLMVNYGQTWLQWGLIDPPLIQKIGLPETVIKGEINSQNYVEVLEYLRSHIFVQLNKLGYKSPYDVRSVESSMDKRVFTMIEQESFRNWIHVGNRTFYKGHKYLSLKQLRDVSNVLPDVLDKYNLLYYNGQFDSMVPIWQTSRYLQQINWYGLNDFYHTERHNWLINENLLGYWKNHDTLTQVMIRNAGHLVGKTQPETLFQMVKWFIDQKFVTRSESNHTRR